MYVRVEFPTLEEAMGHVAKCCGVHPSRAVFQEVQDVEVVHPDSELLRDPTVSEIEKASVKKRLAAQRAFELQTSKGVVEMVVFPAQQGIDCWVRLCNERALA